MAVLYAVVTIFQTKELACKPTGAFCEAEDPANGLVIRTEFKRVHLRPQHEDVTKDSQNSFSVVLYLRSASVKERL